MKDDTLNPEFAAFDRAMAQLLSVSHEEMQRRLAAHKEYSGNVMAPLWQNMMIAMARSGSLTRCVQRNSRIASAAISSGPRSRSLL
jgi:hypothetical protein